MLGRGQTRNGSFPALDPLKDIMLTKEEIRIGRQRVAKLRANPTKITDAARRGADAMLKDQQSWEASKDRSLDNERKALAKDAASFAFNQIRGNFTVFAKKLKINKDACGLGDCYQCHTNGRLGRKAIYKTGFMTYCLSCFILKYIPYLFKQKFGEKKVFLRRVN